MTCLTFTACAEEIAGVDCADVISMILVHLEVVELCSAVRQRTWSADALIDVFTESTV